MLKIMKKDLKMSKKDTYRIYFVAESTTTYIASKNTPIGV